MLIMIVSCSTGEQDKNVVFERNPDCLYIVMFHLSRRCESCMAVERETREVLEKSYKADLDSGEIRFLPFDILSESGKNAAKQLKASGQNLYLVKGDSISDLSGPAFLFANTHPERYHETLKREIEKYLR